MALLSTTVSGAGRAKNRMGLSCLPSESSVLSVLSVVKFLRNPAKAAMRNPHP